MIRPYREADAPALHRLWCTAGVRAGYAPMTMEQFARALLCHPDFSGALTFLLEENGDILGFVTGCASDGAHMGRQRGYLTCLLLEPRADTPEHTGALLGALEAALRARGRRECAASFWGPIRLPWVLPGTPGHQHNNLPGIPRDLSLHSRMRELGYREASVECAMHLDLRDFAVPQWVEEKAARMALAGDTVALYDPAVHRGLGEMADSLGNPEWSAVIPRAGALGQPLLVGLHGSRCAGFAGPIRREETGRGWFSGIGVAPEFERRGLGTLLFYRLLEQEQAAGARYMSLFTGQDNPAIEIYKGAGFRIRRTFGVMIKEIS